MIDLEVSLSLTPGELIAVIDGLRAEIAKRAYWMIAEEHLIRTTELSNEQLVFDPMTQAYAKALMLARNNPDIDQEFVDDWVLSDAAWELFDTITAAESWDDIPIHRHFRRCALCEELRYIG